MLDEEVSEKEKEEDDEKKEKEEEVPKSAGAIENLAALLKDSTDGSGEGTEYFNFPTDSDLNTRLRRLVTSYQRSYKREELKNQARAKVRVASYFDAGCFTKGFPQELRIVRFLIFVARIQDRSKY